MKRKEINNLITAQLWDRGGGRGKEYDCYLNQEYVGHIDQLRKLAKEGDYVEIEIKRRHYWYTEDVARFYVEDNDENNELVEYYLQHSGTRGYTSRRRRKRDYQKSRVYNWENDFPKGPELTENQANNLAKEVFETYGYPGMEPIIEISWRHRRTSSYYQYEHKIALARGWGQRQRIVLHELAHALIQVAKIKDIADHGKFFVALVTELYELFLDGDASDIEENIANGVALGSANTVTLGDD